jgi:hypothetical protein
MATSLNRVTLIGYLGRDPEKLHQFSPLVSDLLVRGIR